MVKDENAMDRGRVEVFEEECKGCGLCVDACPPHLMVLSEKLNQQGYHPALYLGQGCTGCGICFFACPEPGAITVFRLDSSVKVIVKQDQSDAAVQH